MAEGGNLRILKDLRFVPRLFVTLGFGSQIPS